MSFLKILGNVAKVAGPVVVGLVAGPAAGVAVAGGMIAGKGAAEGAKKLSAGKPNRPEKIAAPVVAVGLPAVLAPLVAPEALDQICGLVARACESPAAMAAVPGLLGWLFWAIGSNIKKVAG